MTITQKQPQETSHGKEGGGGHYEILVLWVTWLEPETQDAFGVGLESWERSWSLPLAFSHLLWTCKSQAALPELNSVEILI